MKELFQELTKAIQTFLFFVSYVGVASLFLFVGKALMHQELTNDMKRNQEAGIPCRNKAGEFYLYTHDTSYIEWERKTRGINNGK